MNIWRRAITLVSLVVVVVTSASCISNSANSGTTSTSGTTAVPLGWKTYTYGKAAIAVPSGWAVKYDTNCPNAPAPGTLLLGLPKMLSFCAAFQYPASVVRVSQITTTSSTTVPAGEKPVTVNGIAVELGFGSPATLQWTVPSLGVQITGTGPDSRKVMQTLHKA